MIEQYTFTDLKHRARRCARSDVKSIFEARIKQWITDAKPRDEAKARGHRLDRGQPAAGLPQGHGAAPHAAGPPAAGLAARLQRRGGEHVGLRRAHTAAPRAARRPRARTAPPPSSCARWASTWSPCWARCRSRPPSRSGAASPAVPENSLPCTGNIPAFPHRDDRPVRPNDPIRRRIRTHDPTPGLPLSALLAPPRPRRAASDRGSDIAPGHGRRRGAGAARLRRPRREVRPGGGEHQHADAQQRASGVPGPVRGRSLLRVLPPLHAAGAAPGARADARQQRRARPRRARCARSAWARASS